MPQLKTIDDLLDVHAPEITNHDDFIVDLVNILDVENPRNDQDCYYEIQGVPIHGYPSDNNFVITNFNNHEIDPAVDLYIE